MINSIPAPVKAALLMQALADYAETRGVVMKVSDAQAWASKLATECQHTRLVFLRSAVAKIGAQHGVSL